VGPKEVCAVCSKTVFWNERIAAINLVYHKDCFRCSDPSCKKKLDMGSFKSIKEHIYCSKHYGTAEAEILKSQPAADSEKAKKEKDEREKKEKERKEKEEAEKKLKEENLKKEQDENQARKEKEENERKEQEEKARKAREEKERNEREEKERKVREEKERKERDEKERKEREAVQAENERKEKEKKEIEERNRKDLEAAQAEKDRKEKEEIEKKEKEVRGKKETEEREKQEVQEKVKAIKANCEQLMELVNVDEAKGDLLDSATPAQREQLEKLLLRLEKSSHSLESTDIGAIARVQVLVDRLEHIVSKIEGKIH